jgi:nitroreductase
MDAADRRSLGQPFADLIAERRSSPRVVDPAPDDTVMARLLAAAVSAPDHGRLRPWRFITIRGEARSKLGDLLAEALKAREPGATPDVLDRERQKPMRGPLVLVVAAVRAADSKIPFVEQQMSAAAATQNILMAAYALGVGAIWKTGDAAYDDRVKVGLGLRPEDSIVGFLYVGANPPAGTPPASNVDWRAHTAEWTGR